MINREEMRSRPKGWSRREEETLFSSVENARSEGVPLKSVFAQVALATGRKPNSIRNYYYARVKNDTAKALKAGHGTAFVPFGEDEIRLLLRHVLTEQARGVSVRACTLKMGGGDNKAMLRYQNKYRSIIKNNPALVSEVIAELESEGLRAFDPYCENQKRRIGRPKKREGDMLDAVAYAVGELSGLECIDAHGFFTGLAALAAAVKRGELAETRLSELLNEGSEAARSAGATMELREALRQRDRELALQNERFMELLMIFKRLVAVNRSFLCMTGVSKMSALGAYVKELQKSVADCESVVAECAIN